MITNEEIVAAIEKHAPSLPAVTVWHIVTEITEAQTQKEIANLLELLRPEW